MQAPKRSSYDVVIVGGAMIGSSIAWFLSTNPGFNGSIMVVEKDPSYEFTSTSRTNSCIRQQFSNEINIHISRFGAEFIRNFRDFFHHDPRVPEITLKSFGYMYLADSEAKAEILKEMQALQSACGAGTTYMTADAIAREYPFYNLDGIVGGNHNRIDEGYFDGNTMFDWWKRSSAENGVEYVANEVVGIDVDSDRVQAVTLSSGETVSCGMLVNAAGPRAALLAQMAGIELPVEPRKRYTFVFSAQEPLDRDLPLTINPSGVHMRSDGAYYLAGCAPDQDQAVDYDDFSQDHALWEEKVWPALAERVPQFEAIRLINSWAGHYAYNTLDQNAVLGPHDRVENFVFANGFSGHGFQQAPAVGRGMAEWITFGEYRSLDLGPFSYHRIRSGTPFLERAVI